MAEETDGGFKVVDRRPFTVEGARREDAPVKEERAAAEPKKEPRPSGKPGDERVDEGFAMLVELLANGALTHLGLMDAGEGLPVNLPGARTMIDLIGVLEAKTKNNLTSAEQKFLGEILFELHTRFVQAQNHAAPKRR